MEGRWSGWASEQKEEAEGAVAVAAGGGGLEVWEEPGWPSPAGDARDGARCVEGTWRGRWLEGESPRESGRRSCAGAGGAAGSGGPGGASHTGQC